MCSPDEAEITQILNDLHGETSDTAIARLLPLVYEQLRSLSDAYLAGERPDHTLQATALVHEAYLRLAGTDGQWKDRGHFFWVAARTMRRILINHAHRHRAAKRGGGRGGMTITDGAIGDQGLDLDVLALDDALQRLRARDEEKARVVELRFFGGCTLEETAEALGISTATVTRHWRFARAWLRGELGGE